ncbi:ABC transporter substrate-binding protein [Halalkalicoccus jeotgali]|uniref:Thiamine pyrimidine synthase n=1 Tax=Halalkalicoccus jeotgali (strain DSM 18796 / CECT 7217 / JCM 14584 / KCTC 4019 / B3) TaxID=795797 RepID=D8J9E0_HALJB|nr:ABC transporter substrate-binding protein [Halalkalicoccus jeotgali]ADJ14352.1 NMT1/THI5 like domain protein [Halalkalicoccus jeotgali B3]ELY40615.1 NMT1/THI5 like domain-containing protein [Halalkalicoccus jeotgali B3]
MTVTFQLNWEPNGFQAPYFLARERGFYEEEGLDVAFVEGHGSPFAAEEAARGRADFALAGASAVLSVASQGHEPLAVAAVTQKTPAAVYTLRDVFGEPLEDPTQLAGRTVAPSATKTRILAAQLLEDAGIRDEIDLLDVDPHTHHRVEHQLLDGSVDAAVGVVTNGVELEREHDRKADELPIGDFLEIYGMTLVTNPDFAAGNPEVVRGFLRATARGWAAATEDPEAAIDALVARNATLERDREIERIKFETAAEKLQFTEHVRGAGWGNHDTERWETLEATLAETDLLEGAVDSRTVWTNEYLDSEAPAIAEYADLIGR